jgi:threonine synthase
VASSWESLVDGRYSAEQSLVLRYAPALNHLDLGVTLTPDTIEACSVREGARSFQLTDYRGVEVHVCDESSLMATGTYKDLDACLINTISKQCNLEQIAISSGGNLGFALAVYGERSGLRSFFFQPKSTMYKLDGDRFEWGGAKLISVDLPEKQVKSLALAFAKAYGIQHVPDIRWRLAASATRAMFLLEQAAATRSYDCIAQAMCAGYGPAGIFNCYSELSREGYVRRSQVPRFLGFQQLANSPMVNAWQRGDREISREHVNAQPDRYIEPGLYNTNPERNYTRLFDLIRYYGGEFAAVDNESYARWAPQIVQMFRSHGMEFTRVSGSDEILEKTGLITAVGVFRAIEEGLIRSGERVLMLVTGGFRTMSSTRIPLADCEVDASRTEDQWVDHLGALFGLPKAPPRSFSVSRM